jgi:hypothetical protein
MRAATLGSAFLNGSPAAVIDDAQLGGGLAVPFALGVLAGDALSRGRVLEEALPIVDDAADVELIVEDAVAPPGRAEQGRGIPMPAGGSGDSLAVQIAHDRQRPLAPGVFAKDATNDVGLGRIDGAASPFIAVLEHVVAIALAARDAARPDPADLAPARFLRQVLQEQCRHGALETDVNLGHRAIGERLDTHAEELQPLEERAMSAWLRERRSGSR